MFFQGFLYADLTGACSFLQQTLTPSNLAGKSHRIPGYMEVVSETATAMVPVLDRVFSTCLLCCC